MKKLHPTQQRLLEILKRNGGEALTIRELQTELDLSSPSLVHFHIQQLEKKGHITRNPANPADWQVVAEPESEICYLNLYGMARCGSEGTILDGTPVDRVPLSCRLLGIPPAEAFLLKAQGDSMAPRIEDGSILIVRKTHFADNQAVIACAYTGKAYIKQLVKEQGIIKLRSFNPVYADIQVQEDTLKIEGIIKGVLSYLNEF